MAEAGVPSTDTDSISCNRNLNEYTLAFDEIRQEIPREEGRDRKGQCEDKTDAICDLCFLQNLNVLSKNVAFYLCYLCEHYLCDKCFIGHESHKHINLVSKKRERDEQIQSFLDEMIDESKREDEFERENIYIVDRVKIKHELDRKTYCYATGLCGLSNNRWVVSDFCNCCIKIFTLNSNILQRYIRFGSYPNGVTEIKFKRKHTVISEMSTSESDISESDEQCTLAVTLPLVYRICFIDISKSPALKIKSMKTKKRCYSLDFSENNMFVLCRDDIAGSPWCVSVMTTDGVTITITTEMHNNVCDIAVSPGRVFISDVYNHKVSCMNYEGNIISHKTIIGSQPGGISVDRDSNKLYICAPWHNKILRLDSRLESLKSILYLKDPGALLFYENKLYIGHVRGSTNEHFVTVVRVL